MLYPAVKEYLREIRLEMEAEQKYVDAEGMQLELLRRLPADHPWRFSAQLKIARKEVNDYCQSLLTADGKRSHHQTTMPVEDGEDRSIYAEPKNMTVDQVKKTADYYARNVRSAGRAALHYRDLVVQDSDHPPALKKYVQSVLEFVDGLDLDGGEETLAS